MVIDTAQVSWHERFWVKLLSAIHFLYNFQILFDSSAVVCGLLFDVIFMKNIINKHNLVSCDRLGALGLHSQRILLRMIFHRFMLVKTRTF